MKVPYNTRSKDIDFKCSPTSSGLLLKSGMEEGGDDPVVLLDGKRKAEAEDFNVREYCQSIGVDIDNIDMSKVDKSLFRDEDKNTKETMEKLKKAGYVREVTRQGDLQFMDNRN